MTAGPGATGTVGVRDRGVCGDSDAERAESPPPVRDAQRVWLVVVVVVVVGRGGLQATV